MKYPALFMVFAIALVSIVNSQYITTSNGYDNVLIRVFEDFKNILGNTLFEKLKQSTFEEIKEEDIAISNIKVVSTNVNVDDSYGNMNINFYLISPSKSSITFNFDYRIGSQEVKQAQLELSIYDLRIYLKSDLNSNVPTNKVDTEYLLSNFAIYGEVSVEDKAKLQTSFNNAMVFLNKIKEDISECISTYQIDNLNQKKPFKFVVNSILGQRKAEINLNNFVSQCEEKERLFETAVCYFSGNASMDIDKTVKDAAFADSTFAKYNGNKKIFINYKILADIIKKMNEDKPIIMNLTKESLEPEELPYKFTVKSLQTVCTADLLKDLQPEDEFSVSSSVKNLSMNPNGRMELSSVVNVKGNALFTFDFTFDFKVQINVDSELPKFNLCIREVTLGEVKVVTENAIADPAIFSDWIRATLLKAIDYKVCLSDDFITLRNYLNGKLTRAEFGDNGLYIEGKSLYSY